MTDPIQLALLRARSEAAATALRTCNDLTLRRGIELTEGQIAALVAARSDALIQTGRIEVENSVLPKLVYAFFDSPFIQRDEFAPTLAALQELFYTFKNESEDSLTDDELIEALQAIFSGKAQGSLDYLENLTVADLYRALRATPDDDDEDDWVD